MPSISRTRLLIAFALAVSFASEPGIAQCDRKWVPDVGNLGVTGVSAWQQVTSVHALATYDDGTGPALFAGGTFTSAGGVQVNGIAKWDGFSWSNLGTGVAGGTCCNSNNDTYVEALEVFDDGSGSKLYVGGKFTTAGGIPCPNIARWNGTSWESVGGGCNDAVLALKATTQMGVSLLLVGGQFTSAGGGPYTRIASWSAFGWLGLSPGISSGFVRSIEIFDDGSGPAIYVGGSIAFIGLVAKWDATGFHALPGFGGPSFSGFQPAVNKIKALNLGSGPALYAGGGWGGSPQQTFVKWQNNQWLPATTPEPQSAVRDIDVVDLGSGPQLCVATDLFQTLPAFIHGVATWNGSAWTPLSPAGMLANNYYGYAKAVVLHAVNEPRGPSLYVGGDFEYAGSLSSPAHGIGRHGSPKPVLSLSQSGGPGSPGLVRNGGLLDGHEYFNLFSLESCGGAVGSGPFFGLCANDLWFLISQAFSPVGALPYHFVATAPNATFGPYSVPPGLYVEGVCVDVSVGVATCTSPVVPYTVL